MDKSALRKIARLRRGDLARAKPDFAAAIADLVFSFPTLPPGPVAGYVPISSEADPGLLMEAFAAMGRALALPAVVAAEAPLIFRQWCDGDALDTGAFGIPEPTAAAETVTPALVLMPLLAFDAAGWRLGYGGGYYDRTLTALRAGNPGNVVAAGIAFAGQEIAAVPHEDFDQPLDLVVTEAGVRRF